MLLFMFMFMFINVFSLTVSRWMWWPGCCIFLKKCYPLLAPLQGALPYWKYPSNWGITMVMNVWIWRGLPWCSDIKAPTYSCFWPLCSGFQTFWTKYHLTEEPHACMCNVIIAEIEKFTVWPQAAEHAGIHVEQKCRTNVRIFCHGKRIYIDFILFGRNFQ